MFAITIIRNDHIMFNIIVDECIEHNVECIEHNVIYRCRSQVMNKPKRIGYSKDLKDIPVSHITLNYT